MGKAEIFKFWLFEFLKENESVDSDNVMLFLIISMGEPHNNGKMKA